ncbi:unnamed protein product [marine sediment metagenome]|uniref:Uncharacterized protein n=1 Tax=marine sediment metagenome TaxID=412755 RepID=X1FIV3_9ZZZZ
MPKPDRVVKRKKLAYMKFELWKSGYLYVDGPETIAFSKRETKALKKFLGV